MMIMKITIMILIMIIMITIMILIMMMMTIMIILMMILIIIIAIIMITYFVDPCSFPSTSDSPLLIWIQSADHSKHNEGWSVCIIHEMFWAWTVADIPQPIDTCSLKISCIQCLSNATYMCEIYLLCVYCIGNVPANIHSNSQYLTHFYIQGGL